MDSLQIGQYVLEEKLGEGGMAEVWRARNVFLDSFVAIKFLTPRFAGNPEIEQRFLGEGKRQANLQHPNIVSALDFLYVDGRSYLVMRYINGESLDQRLYQLQTPMPLPAALSISKDVLSALDYAHSEGVIHRDIKPSNILLDRNGKAYVLDFGIALALGERRVTRAGTAIGTPHYMSPEQIVGSKDFDHRSDIYSFGCVLYQLLTQTPPFDFREDEGDTEYFVKDQHLRQPPRPPRQLNSSIPDNIERVVLRCLEKKAADRYNTCAEVIAALTNNTPARARTLVEQPHVVSGAANEKAHPATTFSNAPSPPNLSSKSRFPKLALALGAVLLLAAGTGYIWHSRQDTTKPDRTETVASVQTGAETQTTPPQAASTIAPPSTKPARNAKQVPATKKEEHALDTAGTSTSKPSPDSETAKNAAAPPVILKSEPAPVPQVANPQFGILRCPNTPVYQDGKVTFQNLPQERLKFTWDRARWQLLLHKAANGQKDLTLVSIVPGIQTGCSVRWDVVP